MPKVLKMQNELGTQNLTQEFLKALLFAWENLDELRILTHALLKQAILHLTAQIDTKVKAKF